MVAPTTLRAACLTIVSLKIVVPLILLCVVLTSAQCGFPRTFCTTWNLTSRSVGGDSALISTDVRLTYNYAESGITKNLRGPNIVKNNETDKGLQLELSRSEQFSDGCGVLF